MAAPKRPQYTPPADHRCIRVRGAREHNLRSLDVDIPRDKLVVITGLSGSGKSSLAFDTIFAEGQRKYMESLSAYARQFLDRMQKPDVDDIEGLPPTIAIEQRAAATNPRSTVATSTEIYDYLRLLFARCGTPTCWHPIKKKRDGSVTERCGLPISSTSASQIVDSVMTRGEGARLMVLAPVIRGKKGFHREVLEDLQKQGFVRARVNGAVADLREALKAEGENPLDLGRYEKHTIEAVVDRVVLKEDSRQRLADSIETALRVGEGVAIVSAERDGPNGAKEWDDAVYSEKHACDLHPQSALEELEPRLFSFNSPYGACPECDGLGVVMEFDEELCVPDPSKPVLRGAIEPWWKARMWFRRSARRFAKEFKVDPGTPYEKLTPDIRRILMHGLTDKDRQKHKVDRWKGVLNSLRDWWRSTDSDNVRDWLAKYMRHRECPSCNGDRLRIESLSVLVRTGEKLPDDILALRERHALTGDPHRFNISDFTRLTISDAQRIIGALELTEEGRRISEPILREINNRLGFMASVGLEYLSLNRRTGTLSGGEAQRIRLATQVGSGLVGACYVLDEPTIGLHARDNERLIRTLRRLTDIGNSVIVVEHDEEMIRAADHVVDIGPGPGVHGGRVSGEGSIDDLIASPDSVTGLYLSRERSIAVPEKRRSLDESTAVTVKGAREHNLKEIDAAFPLGGLVCVTGVSGSGKSTLVNDILLRAARRHLTGSREAPGAHARINGLHRIDRVIEVDQTPIGRTPRSNPATYTGLFDDVRRVFAKTKEARIRGYQPGRFSFNVKGGRCEACQGHGLKKIEMHFLPDVFVPCEVCRGGRYNRETLEVTYRGRSIADVLRMTVEDAVDFFENHPKIVRFAKCLLDVGLGYLELGQPSTTLSGGEAQRVKLATELGKGDTTGTLYVLDEPTTGLHFEDVNRLCHVLDRLADSGSTLIVIEHNLDVIKRADWIIDLGPEGGDKGGRIIAAGTPEEVARTKGSYTGEYLAPLLGLTARANASAKPASGAAKKRTTKPASKKRVTRAQPKKKAAKRRAD